MSHGLSSVVLKPLLTPTTPTLLPFLYPTLRRTLHSTTALYSSPENTPDHHTEIPFDSASERPPQESDISFSGTTTNVPNAPRRKRWVPDHAPSFSDGQTFDTLHASQEAEYNDPNSPSRQKKGAAFMVRFRDYEIRRRAGITHVPTEGYARPSAIKSVDYRDQILSLGGASGKGPKKRWGGGVKQAPVIDDGVSRHAGVTKGEKEIFSRIFATLLEQERRLKDPALPLGNILWGKPPLKQIIYSAQPSPSDGSKISVAEYPHTPDPAEASHQKRRARQKLLTQRNRQVLKIEEALLHDLSLCTTNSEIYDFVTTNIFGLFLAAEKDLQLPSIVESYPRLIAAAMHTLRTRFHDHTGVSFLFSRLKSLGADSYVIGASGEVYAEVLASRWHGFRDLAKVVELCEEIDQNGVDPTESLVLQMREVLEEVGADIAGRNGAIRQALCTREEIFANDELGSIVGEWGRKWFAPKPDEEAILHEIEGLDDIHEGQQA